MKLIIEISSYDKEWITNGYYIPEEINIRISEAIVNGTPLDDVKAEIDEQYDRVHPYNIDVAQGLEMARDILDGIGKESEE